MRALLVGDNEMMNAQVHDSIVRSGFDCRSTDILPVKSAAECAGRVCRDLIVLVMSSEPEAYLAVLRELRSTTHAAMLAIGPADNPKFILRVLREGADEYLDQEELGQLEPALVRLKLRRMPQNDGGAVIGLLSGNGGSGTSTLATNLATALAQKHERTALFDLRSGVADQTVLLDLKPTHTLADLCRGCERMDQSMLEQSLVRHRSGLHLLAAPDDYKNREDVTSQGVRRALNIARTLFPYVILDLDRSFGPEQLAAIVQADLLLLTVRLDITSLRNAHKILVYLDDLGVNEDRVRVVVNRYGQKKELPLRRAEQALGLKVFQTVPDDPASINSSANKGVPVVIECPRAKVSKSIRELADSVGNAQNYAQRKPHIQTEYGGNGVKASDTKSAVDVVRFAEARQPLNGTPMKGAETYELDTKS